MDATPTSFFVRNNVFYEARLCALNPWDADWSWLTGDELDYNLYLQSSGHVMCAPGQTAYTQAEFAAYQSETGRDAHSLAADPLFLDPAGADFHLQVGSPAIDQGVDTGIAVDIEGTARPQGDGWDIGAYEYHAAEPPDGGSGGAAGGHAGGAVGGGVVGGSGGTAGAPPGSEPSGEAKASSGCGCVSAGRPLSLQSCLALAASIGLALSRARRRGATSARS
jgi:hypothetical protein